MQDFRIIAYGLTDELVLQLGPDPAVVAARLRAGGVAGVFLKLAAQLSDRDSQLEIVEQLRAGGLAVFASQPVFLAQDDLWTRFPQSRPVTAAGAPAPVEEWYHPARPTDEDVRRLRLAQIEARLVHLPLDGLWLDFIRWPARWEKRTPNLYHSSFDAHTLARFAADTGIAVPGDGAPAAAWILAHAADAWWAWRCRQIETFVADVAALRDRHRPGAQLGLFTIPWTGTSLDELPVAQANTRIVGQDPRGLSRHADVLSPMVYHRLCGRAPAWPAAVTAWLRDHIDAAAPDAPAAVWPVIERLADDESYPPGEYAHVAASCRAAGSGPVIVFNLAGWLAQQG